MHLHYVMLCYVWSIALYGLETWILKKIGTEIFGELRNVVLDENGEDKMARENNLMNKFLNV